MWPYLESTTLLRGGLGAAVKGFIFQTCLNATEYYSQCPRAGVRASGCGIREQWWASLNLYGIRQERRSLRLVWKYMGLLKRQKHLYMRQTGAHGITGSLMKRWTFERERLHFSNCHKEVGLWWGLWPWRQHNARCISWDDYSVITTLTGFKQRL